METLGHIAHFIRWRDWGPGKVTVLWMLCLYLAVAYNIPFDEFMMTFVVFMLFAATQSALGYVLNEWGDRDLDRRQFKRNSFNGKSTLESVLALTLILVMAIVTGAPLVTRPGFLLLWVVWAIFMAAYSLEPIRLKTKGLVGLTVSFVAQWFLPVLITFSAFDIVGGVAMWVLAFALTITGMTLEIAHQRYDRTRDMLTRAETFAVRLSDQRVDRIYAFALLCDKVAIGLIVAVVALAIEPIGVWWATSLVVLLAISYGGLFLLALPATIRGLNGQGVEDPYYGTPGDHTPSQLLHETMLNFLVPVVLSLAATLRSPLYGFIFGLFLLWRVVLGRADWTWPLRELRMRFSK